MSDFHFDNHNRYRNLNVGFRLSPEEKQELLSIVALTGLTEREYIASRVLNKDVIIYGNPKVYKALRAQMERIVEELQRLQSTSDVTDEFVELIRFTLTIYDGMKGTNNESLTD